MNDNRAHQAWADYLAGEPLSIEDERILLEAFQSNDAFRQEALRDAATDGLLRVEATPARDSESLIESVFERMVAENDATGFIKRVDTRIDRDGDSPRSGEAATPRRRSTRRRARRAPGQGNRNYLLPALLAAGLLLGVVLLLSQSSSGPSPSEPGRSEARRDALRKQAEKESVRAQQARKEAETLVAGLRVQEKQAEEARKAAEKAQDEDLRKNAEEAFLDIARKRKAEENRLKNLREAEEAANQALANSSAEPKPQEKSPETTGTRVAVAKVESVEGEVYIVSPAGKATAKAEEDLQAGEGLEVGATGTVVLTFADRTRVEVGPNAALRELKSEGGKRIFIAKGEVHAAVAKQPKEQAMVFVTPHGEATVLGTTLRLVIDPNPKEGTRLEVTKGMVRLKNLAGKTVDVPSGHFAVAAIGTVLTTRPIPPLPRTRAEALLQSHGKVVINFGPEGGKLPEGTLNDSGDPFDTGRGYGWDLPNDLRDFAPGRRMNRRQAYDKSAKLPDDPLKATFVRAGWSNVVETWRLRIPNGRYSVTVCAGSAANEQGPHHVRVEGLQVINSVVTPAGQFAEVKDVPVQVTDGELTLLVGGAVNSRTASDQSSDTSLNYVIVRSLK